MERFGPPQAVRVGRLPARGNQQMLTEQMR